jgi:hypothetical protein
VVKEVPGLGVLSIRPAIASVLERVPRARGRAVDHGELFRVRSSSDVLAFVAPTAVVEVRPLPDDDTQQMLAIASGLRVDWAPAESR